MATFSRKQLGCFVAKLKLSNDGVVVLPGDGQERAAGGIHD
jgi:hypothetical protein